jgi:hypothetical protein
MPLYDDSLPLRDALAEYFEANGFGEDGGYNDDWVSGKFGPIPFVFPNSDARKRAVPLHDLHHLITGYDTDGVGEGAIGAWEVASGCGRHWVAWLLNLNAMVLGSFLNARAVWSAFLRGRRSRNYYHRGIDDELLATTLGIARASLLDANEEVSATPADRAAFAAWWSVGLLFTAVPVAVVLGPLAALASWLIA